MANVQTSHKKVGRTSVKNYNRAQSFQRAKNIYCILCRRCYLKHEAQEHMHGMLHHRELETVLGKDVFHECQACKASSMGLNEYAQHISTAQHKAKLKNLMHRKVKPLPLCKTLSAETMDRILERNKLLKKEEKKVTRKKKKKLKQVANQKRAEMLQGAAGKPTAVSKATKLEKSKQVDVKMLKRMQETQQQGGNNAVVQNKENKVSSLQRHPHQREPTLHHQSGRLACFSGEPAGRAWPYRSWDQFSQTVHQVRYGDVSVNKQCSNAKTESSQTGGLDGRPHNTQGGASCMPEQIPRPAVGQNDYYNKPYNSDSDRDFTSDHLPRNGAIIFDNIQNQGTGSSQPGRERSHSSAPPASANRSVNAAPVQDVDVSAMLRQIRRALGVREPCRADREARRQNSEAGVRCAQQAGAERETRNYGKEAPLYIPAAAVQPSLVDSPAPAPHCGDRPPSAVPPATPKQRTGRMEQGTTLRCERSSVAVSDSRRSSTSEERERHGAINSQTLLGRRSASAASSGPNPNAPRKVRIAHEAGKVQWEKEAGLTPTMITLLSTSGARSKVSWRGMYEEMKRKKLERKKLERVKGMPRFGIQFENPPSDRGRATQAEDTDLPLSEGFHWESVPGTLTGAHWAGLPPPPGDTTEIGSCSDTQSDSHMQEALKQPGAAQEGSSSCSSSSSSQTVETVKVKVEPNTNTGGESGDLRDNSSANKRKRSVDDGISDKQPRGGKKKTKSNKDQDQMDQLLTVSLREEELSLSLQDLDKFLDQARNALQAAYTEVQRLLLLRQQCTAEVNSLRAKRIEILQGMQGCYSGAANAAEKATTPSAAVQPRPSPLPSSSTSSSQQPPPTNPAPSASQPRPTPLASPAMPIKQEMCQPHAVHCNVPQIPVDQPLPPLPSDLLASLLLTSPCLPAPPTAASCAKQLQTECPPPATTSPDSSARLARVEVQAADSGEGTGGEPAAAQEPLSTVAPVRDRDASAAAPGDDGGSESDDSVEVTGASNLVVIDIDESDNEERVHREPRQTSVSVEFSSASTQTSQQNDVQRKVQPAPVPAKDAGVPPECVEVVNEEEEEEEEQLYLGAFVNHAGPVHGLQVHEGLLYTCSGDNTARAYSLTSRECQAVFEGHTNKINCLLVSTLPNMLARLYTGSSDQTIRCYSVKSKKCLEQISLSDRVLCLHVAWNILFAGLANGSVASHDLKTLKQLDVFECHGPRGVSCLGTAQEGARRVLLVGSYDSTISVRDAKSGLLLRSLEGHTKTVLCMKVVNDLVFSGSSDTSIHAHNIHTGELVRIYKGHGHAVTSIVILGKVMVTACLDKLVRVYELQSHDRLQVYGGHSDMVMCMAVHKSVIYTGCYDGSVQAVKLNLMKNYRCWWQNCSLIFGMAEHLLQHLVRDHSNPNVQAVKCRWRDCSTFFASQQSVREELPEHMRSHVENES